MLIVKILRLAILLIVVVLYKIPVIMGQVSFMSQGCGDIINTRDTAICIGSSVVLEGEGYQQYQWTPILGLSNPNIAKPIASPTMTTIYVVSAIFEGSNLIVNGDFEQGNIGFISQYNYNPINIGVNGDYAITDNVINVHPLAFPCTDHTTGTGLLMAVNGGPIPNTTVWQEEVSVMPQADYKFSAWVTNWSSIQSNLAKLQFSVNGQLLGSVFQTLPQQCEWKEFFIIWNSGNAFTADIRLVNQNLAVIGNDFGLDDIEFKQVCQNTDTVTVHVNFPIEINQIAFLCEGDTIWIGDSYHTGQGMYSDSIPGDNGCDSIISTEIIEYPSFYFSQSLTICEGDSVVVGSMVYKKTGFYVDTFQTIEGCDSIILTEVLVHPDYLIEIYHALCEGESFVFGNQILNVSGFYVDNLASVFGCDSIIILDLEVNSVLSMLQIIGICSGDSLGVGVNVYYESGIYTDTLSSDNGCDSVVSTVLTVWPKIILNQNLTICKGDSILVGLNVYKEEGIYRDTLKTFNGCDSVVNTILIVYPIFSTHQEFTICSVDSVMVGTNIYYSSGLYTDILISREGCDSIVTTLITVVPTIEISQSLTLCNGEYLTVGSNIYDMSGIFIDTLIAAGGCDSIVNSDLTILPPSLDTVQKSICHGQEFELGDTFYSVSGVYVDTLIKISGCDSVIVLELEVLDSLYYTQEISICLGDSITVGSSLYIKPGNYVDILQGANGCDSTVYTMINLYPREYCLDSYCNMYAPNVFSPNGDGVNDFFMIYSQTFQANVMSIYDRWGGLLFYREEENVKWDGSTRADDPYPSEQLHPGTRQKLFQIG